ncbi:hypothetical protein [Celeribacter sp.]|uniref:hypothetical protein n=1 Tax=Celeribacter sp. TaxID=1890673 RepID=UPI003A8E070C
MKRLTQTVLITVAAASIAATSPTATLARGGNPMDGVAEQLGLKPAQLKSCLGEPPAQGARPSEAAQAAMIDCLIGQNSSLTADQINAAMTAMRDAPPPPKR